MLALDLETYPIQPGIQFPKPVCYSTYAGEAMTLGPVVQPFAHFMASQFYAPFVGANIAFDMGVILRQGRDVWQWYNNDLITDVAIRQQLIDIEEGLGTKRKYSLKALVKRWFNEDLEKDDTPRLRYHEVEDLPVSQWPGEFVEYAKADALWTWRVWEAQEKNGSENVAKWQHYECRADFALKLMSAWGVRADPVHVDKLLADAGVKYDELQNKLRSLGVLREDGTKDTKIFKALITEAYHGRPPTTDNGNVKTDKLTIEESGDPLLQELNGDGPIVKIHTTYGKVLAKAATEVFHPRYNVLVSSGRTSSDFQQWPRGGPSAPDEVNRLRASFVPRAGNVFVFADWVGCELGTLGEVCTEVVGFSNIADALNQGQDLHTRLAARFKGITYEEALALKEASKLIERQAAKPVNFGLPGLMGAFRLVQAAQKDGVKFCELAEGRACTGSKCQYCLRLAKKYITMWNQEWPEVVRYHNWIQRQNLMRFVSPLTGFVRGQMFPSDAANHPFQHLASRLLKTALWDVAQACYLHKESPMYGARPWFTAHDEIGIEVAKDKASDAGLCLKAKMTAAARQWCPRAKIDVEVAMMTRWKKGAKQKFDKKGKLCLAE